MKRKEVYVDENDNDHEIAVQDVLDEGHDSDDSSVEVVIVKKVVRKNSKKEKKDDKSQVNGDSTKPTAEAKKDRQIEIRELEEEDIATEATPEVNDKREPVEPVRNMERKVSLGDILEVDQKEEISKLKQKEAEKAKESKTEETEEEEVEETEEEELEEEEQVKEVKPAPKSPSPVKKSAPAPSPKKEVERPVDSDNDVEEVPREEEEEEEESEEEEEVTPKVQSTPPRPVKVQKSILIKNIWLQLFLSASVDCPQLNWRPKFSFFCC